MELTIKSRKWGAYTFSMKADGGYVFLNHDGCRCQICKGGNFMGSTLTATPETFEKVVRRWYRQHMEAMK